MNNDNKTNLEDLYKTISDDILNQLRASKIDAQVISSITNMSQEEILNLLLCQDKDYLKYREVNSAIKRLTKSK